MNRQGLVSLSALDTQRWGVVSAKASAVTAANLPRVLAFCREHAVRFLVARCAAAELSGAQAMEREGFQLMDTLIYYARGLGALPPQDSGIVTVREFAAGEEADIGRVARQSFAGYPGHYHADPRLDDGKCDETYVDWAERCCRSKEFADSVLVAIMGAQIVGFVAIRVSSTEGEVALFAVAPQLQRRGIGRSLMLSAMQWCKAQGKARVLISTQIQNLANQKIWTRLGFEPSSAYYTFHKWF